MIGELIPTGVTFGTGRISVNDQFSGTAEFNDVEVSGNLSAGTGGVIYSGGTDLYNIFSTSSGVDYWTAGTGTNSIAQIGGGNISSGITSVAEGTGTIAGGDYSHSEGFLTTAIGVSSHAEGSVTIALGQGSHAEGNNSTADGIFSHAEGGGSYSFGDYSHAEGYQTTAIGNQAHSEGISTTASGSNSHSEGFLTTAIGTDSHAGGFGSIAVGAQSFVHGLSSIASGASTIVFGNGITGTTTNTVYVPYLNIQSLAAGTSVNNLGVDSGGNVVVGSAGGGNFLPLTITGNTTISLSGTSTFVMSGDANDSEQIKIETNFLNNRPASLNIGKGSAALYSESGSSFANSYVSVSVSSAQIGRENGAVIQQISITDTEMKITDTVFAKGLIYDSNYHTNYTNRSLVDKEYVDIAVASGGGVNAYLNVGTTGSTITWNVSGLSTNYEVTLSAATTLNLANVRNGEYGTIVVNQDAVGSRTISLGTVNGVGATHRVANGGGGSIILTSNANARDILTFTYNGSAMYWTVGNDYT